MLQEATSEAATCSTSTNNDKELPRRGKRERILIRIPRGNSGSKRASAESIDTTIQPIVKIPRRDGSEAPPNCDWCDTSPSVGQSQSSHPDMHFNMANVGRQGAVTAPECVPEKEGSVSTVIQYIPKPVERWIGCVDYEPFQLIFEKSEDLIGALINVRIPVNRFDKEQNPALRKRSLWGGVDMTYTDDSDVACILKHVGVVPSKRQPYVKATFRITPKLPTYVSIELNGLESRSWPCHSGLSIQYISARGCDVQIKSRPVRSPLDGCTLKFTSITREPILDYGDILLQPDQVKERLRGEVLHLEGSGATYMLKSEGDQNIHRFTFAKGDTLLFEGLEWNEIGWMSTGLSINHTFVNIYGYRWTIS